MTHHSDTKQKAILLIYGEGGHAAQMKRLAKHLPQLDAADSVYVTYSDDKNAPEWSSAHILCGEIRDKDQSAKPVKMLKALLASFRRARSVFRQYQVKMVISTGPGHAIIPGVLARLAGKKVIHIETWSRFTTYSFTGRFMYRIASEFWIQNESLAELYPNGRFVGRL